MMCQSERARARWPAVLRTIAGTLGAYGVTSLATVALSLLLVRIGMGQAEALIVASFAMFAFIAMATFHFRGVAGVWGWLRRFPLWPALSSC
jgi:hypothetical protein